jgi:hypothetical protein
MALAHAADVAAQVMQRQVALWTNESGRRDGWFGRRDPPWVAGSRSLMALSTLDD